MRRLLTLTITLFCGTAAFAAPDTVSVFFPFNKSLLTEEARKQLDNAIYAGTINDRYPIQIIGYTDEVGTDNYNLQLSMRRAASVKAYLVQSGYQAGRITLITGKGEAQARPGAGPEGIKEDRRVDIVRGPLTGASGMATGGKAPEEPVPGAIRKASNTDLSQVPIGEKILLDNIYFFPGRHYVRPESMDAMDALYRALHENPGIRISIEGHVCCVPKTAVDAMDDDTHRNELSLNRAKVIRDYLVKRGIDPARLKYQGHGHRVPVIDPETSEDDANRNRRVEIRIIK